MGIAVFPAASAGGIKSVQRGSAGSAGNVTITAVDITKAFVNVFGTASSGTVSSSFGMSIGAGTIEDSGAPLFFQGNGQNYRPAGSNLGAGTAGDSSQNTTIWSLTRNQNTGTVTVNAGSNNLVSAVVQGFLANSTTLTVSGACRWEVVEFN